MKSVKRLSLHEICEESIFVHKICEELNLGNMSAFLFFFSKTVVTHMPTPRKIPRSNDGTEFYLSFSLPFFLLGVDTHLKVASIPSTSIRQPFEPGNL